MKYDHVVKYNGIYYPTGADVPVGDTKVEVEEKYEGLPFVDVPEKEEVKEPSQEPSQTTPKKKGRKKKSQ